MLIMRKRHFSFYLLAHLPVSQVASPENPSSRYLLKQFLENYALM